MHNDDIKKNGSGIYDPTAYHAIRNFKGVINPSQKESKKFHNFLEGVWKICDDYGYHLEGHIVVTDVKTGKIWS